MVILICFMAVSTNLVLVYSSNIMVIVRPFLKNTAILLRILPTYFLGILLKAFPYSFSCNMNFFQNNLIQHHRRRNQKHPQRAILMWELWWRAVFVDCRDLLTRYVGDWETEILWQHPSYGSPQNHTSGWTWVLRLNSSSWFMLNTFWIQNATLVWFAMYCAS